MKLDAQKRLAGSIAKRSKSKVKFNPEMLDDIKESITRMDLKNLINQGIKPKGLAVGTHDGEFGEWVPLVLNYMSEILLIEASLPQFNKLKQNFSDKLDISFLNSLITSDGEEVEFFEGGRGYTNSVVKRVIEHWETEKISSTVRSSISLNTIIEENFDKSIDADFKEIIKQTSNLRK